MSDHPALMAAVDSRAPVVPLFILDDHSRDGRSPGGASRWWLAGSLAALDARLRSLDSRLILRRGATLDVLTRVVAETGARGVYFSRGYEPGDASIEQAVADSLTAVRGEVRRFGGGLLFEPEAVKTKAGNPFRVFTPFYKSCLEMGRVADPLAAPKKLVAPQTWPSGERLEDWALRLVAPDWAAGLRDYWQPGTDAAMGRLETFHDQSLVAYPTGRDRPDHEGTSSLSPYLHFGEISPRQIWHRTRLWADVHPEARQGGDAFLRELLWREFSSHLLHHWPHVVDAAFKPAFDVFPWCEDKSTLTMWQRGLTGYPIVDAGMRQLWRTGWMHNRVRMVVASFLTKHLLIHWRDGASWFWNTLVDADLANNTAGWQWVAGSGADAAPYFRIFNPVLQGRKFDPTGDYVRKWVPQLADLPGNAIHAPWEKNIVVDDYPAPIVDHKVARRRALEAYEVLKESQN